MRIPIPALVPRPARVEVLAGFCQANGSPELVHGPEAADAAARLREQMAEFSAPPKGSATAGAMPFRVALEVGGGRLAESYELEILPESVRICGSDAAGLFYGIQTFVQWIEPSEVSVDGPRPAVWQVPCVRISDAPRFSWRGAHLDCARHFFPVPVVKRFLELIARHKINQFHWHLTDDQGWRLEVPRYPQLTEIGAWRQGTRIGHEDDEPRLFSHVPHGGFYSRADVAEIVRYASERQIRVLPEIEMPGHSVAAIASYPGLGNGPKPVEVARHWGIFPNVLNVEERTFEFLQHVLEDVMDLFPGRYIHVGGDECPRDEWRRSSVAQRRIRELGLRGENELQSWFINRIGHFLQSRGRILVGWDEILEPGLDPAAVVMSWRGEEGGIQAARAGHDVVMAPGASTYLNYYQTDDHSLEPLSFRETLTLEQTCAYDPVPDTLQPHEARHILGAQAQLWTEYIPDERTLHLKAWPRLAALAEAFWTPAALRGFDGFSQRWMTHRQRIRRLGVEPWSGSA